MDNIVALRFVHDMTWHDINSSWVQELPGLAVALAVVVFVFHWPLLLLIVMDHWAEHLDQLDQSDSVFLQESLDKPKYMELIVFYSKWLHIKRWFSQVLV